MPWFTSTRSISKTRMAKLALYLLLLVSGVLNILCKPEQIASKSSRPTDFIKNSCLATRYPALCVQSLSGYGHYIRQNERQLAETALRVALSRAQSASRYVTKMTKVRSIKARESKAIRDCRENIGDSVDRLGKSIKEIKNTGEGKAVGEDFAWHMSNVQTWVSAALTDANTCMDGFSGREMDGNVKVAVKRIFSNVVQVTSNALALINRFANRH